LKKAQSRAASTSPTGYCYFSPTGRDSCAWIACRATFCCDSQCHGSTYSILPTRSHFPSQTR
jgi:hypothetical protein